jgi:hypothetical protein
MKRWALFIVLLSVGCGDDPVKPLPSADRWAIRSDSANVAILQIDYLTYEFEGGVLSRYRLCPGCDADTLPLTFSSEFIPDAGWYRLQYVETGDTVFYGTYVWMGLGGRVIPRDLLAPDSFAVVTPASRAPESLQYFPPEIGSDALVSSADSAWAVARSLDITRAFASGKYRVGVLFYPRSVGALDPTYADWIVILYAGNGR